MEKHWYIITDQYDNQRKTTDRQEAKRALEEEMNKVTEVKQQVIYMEHGFTRVAVYVEMQHT